MGASYMTIFKQFLEDQLSSQTEFLTFEEYLDLCKKDPLTYASPAERMVNAIGEPEFVDTSKDPRLSRIFLNKTLKTKTLASLPVTKKLLL